MASFKDLMKAFLYEDVDEDDDDYEEETAPAEVPAAQPAAAASEAQPAVSQQEADKVEEPKVQPAAPQAAPVVNPYQQPAGDGIFSGLDMDSISKPESSKPAPVSKQPYRYDRSKLNTPAGVRRNADGEYKAVISPIFGNLEDDKKQFEAVHDAINLPKPEEGLELTTVISPIFGSQLPEKTHPKAKRKKAAPSKEEKPSVAAPKDLAGFLTREPVAAPVEDVIAQTQAEDESGSPEAGDK